MLDKLSRQSGQPDQLEGLVSPRNIALCRKLMHQRTNAEQRQAIIRLLGAEMAKLRQRSNEPSAEVS